MWSKLGFTLFSFISPLNPLQQSYNFERARSLHSCANHPDHRQESGLEPTLNSRRNIIISAVTLSLSTALGSPTCSNAISSQEAESSYNKYASTYDALDGGGVADTLGIEEARTKILNMATGNVLEIGAGTGLNLSKYTFASSPTASDGVTSLTLLDISDGMMSEAKTKLNSLNVPGHVRVNFVKADATQDLTFLFGTNGVFDTVVDTFSLCVMGSSGAKKCLEQMQNVVKRDSGRIILIENTRSSNAAIGFYQDLTADAAATMGGKGCVSNQNVSGFIASTNGLELISEEEFAAGLFRSFICKRA